jgi:hypothetical protein
MSSWVSQLPDDVVSCSSIAIRRQHYARVPSAFEPTRSQHFSGCEARRSSSFQNTERDRRPAHMMEAPCGSGNVLAHSRSRAEEVPELVVTAAISSRG